MRPRLPLALLSLFVLVPAFAQPFPVPVTPERAVSAAVVTSYIPTRQDVEIASSAHGYAVVWHEDATDYSSRGFVRRFSAAGVPLDDQPTPVVTLLPTPSSISIAAVTIAATDSTYIVGWQQPMTGFVFRRMDAGSGAWIDPQPVSLGAAGLVHLASNGERFVAAYVGPCGLDTCLQSRRINPAGAPLTSPETLLRVPDDNTINELVLGSNGIDYLVTWVENPVCHATDLCGGTPPGAVYALRLRADGTSIDAAPRELNGGVGRPAYGLTMAWSSGRYLLAWSTLDAIAATRIADNGVVLDHDRNGIGSVLLAERSTDGIHFISPLAAGLDNRFVLLIRENTIDLLAHIDTTRIDGVSFAADADLAGVATLPRTPLFAVADNLGRSMSAATIGNTLALAYDRALPEAGTVTRVFLRLFAESLPPARRRVAH